MVAIQNISTHGLDARHKLAFWNDHVSASLLPLVCDPVDPARFDGSISRAKVGDHLLALVHADEQTVRHTKVHVSRMSRAIYYVKLQTQGRSLSCQQGREAELEPGDFALVDGTRPYETLHRGQNSMLVLGVDASLLRERIPRLDDLVGHRFEGRRGSNRLFSQLLNDYWVALQRDLSVTTADRMATMAVDLLAVACLEAGAEDTGGRSSVQHHRRIIGFIETRLKDPRLSPEMIATACGLSKRYVHALMASGDETVVKYIQRRRLEECARELRATPASRRSIATIAYSQGFETHAHFSRAFRARYGVSPSEYRRLTLQGLNLK